MFQEQQARIEINKSLAGAFTEHLGRRGFLSKTFRVGVASSLFPFLVSCGTSATPSPVCSSTSNPVVLKWIHEQENVVYPRLVETFNAHAHPDFLSITVQHYSGDPDTAVHHDAIVKQLQKKQGPDILSLDVTWIDEFAKEGWILPLNELWSAQEQEYYLSTPLQAAKVGDTVYAVPFRSDVGLLFYRTDLFHDPPATWEELEHRAKWAQSIGKTTYGYVWQGAPFEGLFCNFLEVFSGFGGRILDFQKLETFIVDPAVQALMEMQTWIRTGISPQNITDPILDWTQDRALNVWRQGEAAFMRNWSFAIALSYLKGTLRQVAENFDIAPLPGTSSFPGRSCIGGWQLAINKYSSCDKQKAAWTFISYMMQHNAQEYAASQGAFLVTRKDIYQPPDPMVQRQQLLVEKLPDILKNAQFRPRSPCYQQQKGVSQLIYDQIHRALTEPKYIKAPQLALQELQNELGSFVCRV
jgi:multiple sugar transport system substrate-binding protein